MATTFADYNALKKHVQHAVLNFNKLGPKKADSVELTQAARDCILYASPAELGDPLHHKVQTVGVEAAFEKFMGYVVVRWDAAEVRADYGGYNEPLMPSFGVSE